MATSRSIFTYLSDEYIELNSISKDEFWFSLNTACLFFDEIPFSSAALLGHRFLSSAWGSGEWASRLFKSGLIRPVLMGNKHSLVEVASSMIEHGTIHCLDSDNALLRHAEAIDSAGFNELWVYESEFRRRYSTAFEQVIDRLRTEGVWGSGELIRSGELDKLHIWAKERVTSEDLRASSVYRFVDATPGRFSPTATKEVKLLADVTYYGVLRTLLDAACTFAGPQVDLANIVYSAMTSAREISSSDSGLRVEEISCPLPFDRLATLPVEDVLNLRESTRFRDLRATLHDVRNGGEFSKKKIRASLAKCLDLLDHYSRETNANWRDNMLREAEMNKPLRKLDFWLVVAPSAITVAVVVVGKANWLIAGAGLYGLARHVVREAERRSRPERYSLPEATKDHVLINPIDGSLKGKIPDGGGAVS